MTTGSRLAGAHPSRSLVAAFEGWNDAGDAATGAVEHLELVWDAQPLTELDPDDYYDFQVNRPTVSLVNGVSRRITWPTTRLSYCRPPGADFDLVLVRGIEPNMRWRAFCGELLGVIQQLDVRTGRHPRRAAVRQPAHPPDPGHRHRATTRTSAAQYGLEKSRYEGPTGIVGVLQDACVAAGIPAHLVLGRRAALRLAAAEPEGDARAAAPRRGGARPAGAAGRAAAAVRRVAEARRRDGGRGRGGHRVHPQPRGARRRDRPQRARRGFRRRDRPRVRALPAPARPRWRPAGGGRRRPTRPQPADRARPRHSGDAEQRVEQVAHQRGRVRVAPAPGSARSTQSSTAAIAPTVSRSSASRSRTRRARPTRRARSAAPAPRATGRAAPRRPAAGRRSTPGRRGSARRAAPAGSPSGRRPRRAASRRAPGCRGTCSSSRRRARSSRRARSAGRTDAAPVSVSACAALCSWCGKIRSEPPPCTSKLMPEPVQRDHRALDVPARPAAAERGVPGRLAVAVPAPQQRVERVPLAGVVRVAAALGEQREHRRRGRSLRHVAEPLVGSDVEVDVLVDVVGGAGCEQLADRLGDLRDRLDRADVVVRGAAPAAPSCPRGTARSRARPGSSSSRRCARPARAAGRRRR